MIEIDAILKDWSIQSNLPFRTGIVCIKGNVVTDHKNRFEQDTTIITSPLVELDLVNMIARTKNSTYKLEI